MNECEKEVKRKNGKVKMVTAVLWKLEKESLMERIEGRNDEGI